MANQPMWTPSERWQRSTAMARFWEAVREHTQLPLASYSALHRWSVQNYAAFWRLWLQWSGLLWEGDPEPVETPPEANGSPGGRFFHNVRLNFAENLLQHSAAEPALVSVAEARPRQELTHAQLRSQVAALQSHLRAWGIGPGDRVAGFVPNAHEAIVAMLATTALGAVWTSCSPDFGVQGVVDRFGQVAPKVLFAPNASVYAGKKFDCLEKVARIANAIASIEHVAIIPFVPEHATELQLSGPQRQHHWEALIDGDAGAPEFTRLGFNHPLYIMYSSGTTGKPKCIVHGAGGTLLQHTKELMLHTDLRAGDNILYYTTCGWMMWNWVVSALATGATVTAYDGSPAHPRTDRLWELAATEKLTHLGTSPKYIGTCRKADIKPVEHSDLASLRVVLSTGAPLLPEDFDWVYAQVGNVLLASISGGTDIISCFMLGNPLLPVYRGEIQCFGLGMDVAAYDETHHPVIGRKGELVCRKPFVSMPIAFWNDPEYARYRRTYFHTLADVWFHGDYIEVTGSQGEVGGIVVYGRSDATLNPSGVRIGTAEIYRPVETLPEVADSIVIGQPDGEDVRVVLFVQLAPGVEWNDALAKRIKRTIREQASPRHVPAVVLPVAKIPYTMSGKKVELAVQQIVCGDEPSNADALADPTALDSFRDRPELA